MLSHSNYETMLEQGEEVKPIRLLIVDDHPIVRKSVALFLASNSSIQIIGEAVDGMEAIWQAKQLRPDVILMDISMPKKDGIEAIAELKRALPEVKIIVFTISADAGKVRRAFAAGAKGYLLKNSGPEMLIQAIQAAQKGVMLLDPNVTNYLVEDRDSMYSYNSILLTEREKEVLQLMAKGMSNKQIAQGLHVSLGTTKIHVSKILNKLQVNSRVEAAKWAVRTGVAEMWPAAR